MVTLLSIPGISDVLLNVLTFLDDPCILIRCATICKLFSRAAVSPMLWQHKCSEALAEMIFKKPPGDMTFLAFYAFLKRCVWASKNPNVVLSLDKLSVRTTSPAFGWRTVCTSAPILRAADGKHSWCVRVGQLGLDDPYVCAGGRIIIGAVADSNDVAAPTRIGDLPRSWGYVSHDGNRVCDTRTFGGAYAVSYGVRDVIRVTYDGEARTLSFEKNGQALGVAFEDVIMDVVFPAVSVCFASATLLRCF